MKKMFLIDCWSTLPAVYDLGRSLGLDWEPQQSILRDIVRTTNRNLRKVVEITVASKVPAAFW